MKVLEGDLTDLNAVRSAVRDSGLSHANGDVIIECAGKPKAFQILAGKPMLLPAVRPSPRRCARWPEAEYDSDRCNER